MSNLIITIISIALIAVAAIMAIWYGGGAYSSGTAKAQAATVIQFSNQIAAAWQAYAVDRAGDYYVTAHSNGINVSLVPTYLASAIEIANIANQNSGRPNPVRQTATTSANNVTDANSFRFAGLSKEVCEQINLIISGSTQVDTDPGQSTRYPRTAEGYCYYSAAQNAYYFAKRVFN